MWKPLTLRLVVAVAALTVFACLQATAHAQQQAAPEGNGRLAGRVLSVLGGPVTNAEVGLACPPLPVRRVLTDQDGRFELTNLRTGNCAIRVTKPGFVDAHLPENGSYGLTIDDRTRRENVALVLRVGVVLTGRVSLPGGVPAGPAFLVHPIRIDTTAPNRLKAAPYVRLQPDGTFRFENLSVGDYYVAAGLNPNQATDAQTGYALTYYPGTPEFGNARVVSLQGGQSAAVEINMLPAPLYAVSGQVVDRTGVPVGGAQAMLTFAEPPNYIRGSVTADDAGWLKLHGIQAGRYGLVVAGPSRPGQPFDTAEMRIEIGDRDVVGVVLALKPRK